MVQLGVLEQTLLSSVATTGCHVSVQAHSSPCHQDKAGELCAVSGATHNVGREVGQ